MNQTFKKEILRILAVCFASFIMAANIKTFVQTGALFPGGATGMTLLIQQIARQFFDIEISYSLINILLNAVPVYIGFRFIGRKFTLYSCLMIFLTGIFTDIIPSYAVTYDILLISIFGGLINGFVISLCLKVDATSGGTDFIAIYFSEKNGTDSFNISLGINTVILVIAGLLFGWDKALYSIIFQFTSTQVLHVLYKSYQQETLFIVTNKPSEVCAAISDISHHGATILRGEGSYEGTERDMVYSVISSSQTKEVISAIRKIDEKAFINAVKTHQLRGHFYHKPKE